MKIPLMEKYNQLSGKSKNIVKVLGAVVIVIILYTVFSSKPEEPKKETKQEVKLVNKELTNATDQQLSDKIALERQIKALNERFNTEVTQLLEENRDLRNEIESIKNGTSSVKAENKDTDNSYPQPPPGYGYPQSQGTNQYPTPPPQIKTESLGGIRRVVGQQPPSADADKKLNAKNNYFPTTTLLKGTLLNGLYAPTLAKGKSNPHPAIIRIDDLSILPNELRRNIEGCRLLGEAYGELSDSRVHIRLTTLACTTKDGQAYIDNKVKGVVFGEDGTLGVPGEMLGNFNKILLHTFFMESMAGLGNAIREMSGTTVINSDGTSINKIEGDSMERAGKIMIAGGGEGLGKGFETIANFYLTMLNDMVPVIKINGGRNIEITFTEGIELKLQTTEWTWEDLL